jgi:hypothetical protein
VRYWLRKVVALGRVLSGWFILYVAIGGCIGAAISRPYQNTPSCLPFHSIFGVIESTCPNEAVNLFWLIIVGVPRLLIICPAVVIAMVKAALSGMSWHWRSAAWWLVYSIPFLIIASAGASYWWTRRHRAIATVAPALILLEIVALGLAL